MTETEKIVTDVESTASGTVLKILVQAGEEVPITEPCCYVGDASDEVPGVPAASSVQDLPAQPETPSAPEKAAEVPAKAEAVSVSGPAGRKFSTPAARYTAKQFGVDIALISGTGPNGRIQKADVLAFAESSRIKITPIAKKLAAEYGVDYSGIAGSGPNGRIQKADILAAAQRLASAPAPVDKVVKAAEESVDDGSWTTPVTSLRRVIAERLTASKQNIPHIYMDVDVDASSMISARNMFKDASARKNGKSITYNDIVLKAVATAISEFQNVNARFEGNVIRYFKNVNLGVAVNLPNGLMVPVIRNAEQLSMAELSHTAATLAERAKSGKILPDDLTGGVFTVSNIGNVGIETFHAIINPPESGIIAVASVIEKPVVVNHQLEIRPMMKLSGSFDHRILDGAVAAKFMVRVKELLEDSVSLFF